ncbi:MAG: methyl-accepting chemotaxis protein, partial [Gammaproteobacteria bacterium]|nr:methyl-accepting chemotaxis protein [Gammaproteobacteria bacterium]
MESETDSLSFHIDGDRVMRPVLWFLFVFSLVLAPWHSTWISVIIIGLPSTLIPIFLMKKHPGAFITRASVAVSFMVYAGLEIHQSHGITELHFGVFVLLSFLLYYRDWRIIVIGAGVIAVHHLIFNYLQAWNLGVYLFYNGPSLTMVFTHAAYVVFESAILIYMAVQVGNDGLRNEELKEISKHFVVVDGVIDLKYRKENPKSDFANDFNTFMTVVNEAICESQETARELVESSDELQSLSTSAREGIIQQQHNTGQVVSAVDEMALTMQTVAKNAIEAEKATENADVVVQKGSNVVAQSITALTTLAEQVDQASDVINRLESYTKDISVVLEVIKNIADQTNLLALNATIEAARAGEHGRGFGVVADEVRALASQTQQSTGKINLMISKLQDEASNAVEVMQQEREQAHQGVQHARNTDDAFKSIAESVVIISKLNTQIASAGEQQNLVVDEIQQNIVEINKV